MLDKSAEVAERHGFSIAAGSTEMFFSGLAFAAGHIIECERRARHATELLQPLPALRAVAFATLGQALLGLDRRAEAFEASNQAMALLDHAGGARCGESLMRLINAETRMAMGDRDSALAALRSAALRIAERADRITDLAVRAKFLATAENARTLELARTWRLEV